MSIFKKFLLLFNIFVFLLTSECGIYRKVDTREVSTNADERARKAVNEGRGVNLRGVLGGGNRGFEFSSSNPLWRASLETLDFLPLSNVDYSGGVIISDWYSASNSDQDYIKISLRFLSNEIRSDSLKVTVFKKRCSNNNNCSIQQTNSKIQEELIKSILVKAAEIDKQDKEKK